MTVPAVPLTRIRLAASVGSPKRRSVKRAIIGAWAGAFSLTLIAATAVARFDGVHVSLGPSGQLILQYSKRDRGQFVDHPTATDLHEASAHADFPVQFPTGLPANAPLRQMYRAGTSVIMLQYDLPGSWRRDDHQLWIVLANPAAVNRAGNDPASADHLIEVGPSGPGRVRWQVGGEIVIVPRSTILPNELARIKQSMIGAHTSFRER